MRGAHSLTGGPDQTLRLRALADVLIWVLLAPLAFWLRDRGVGPLPFSVPVIEGALLVVLFGARLFQRAQQEAPTRPGRAARGGQRTLIYGAGEGGVPDRP